MQGLAWVTHVVRLAELQLDFGQAIHLPWGLLDVPRPPVAAAHPGS